MTDPDRNARARLGVATDRGFVFTCASCARVAARLRVSTDGEASESIPVAGGEPLTWTPGAPFYVLEFLGHNSGLIRPPLVDLLVGAPTADPLAIAALAPDLGAFCCRECRANYCATCWSSWIEFDETFYDCTRGRCPHGHEQMLDD